MKWVKMTCECAQESPRTKETLKIDFVTKTNTIFEPKKVKTKSTAAERKRVCSEDIHIP